MKFRVQILTVGYMYICTWERFNYHNVPVAGRYMYMYIYIYACKYIYVYIIIFICACIYAYIYVYKCISMFKTLMLYLHIYACIYMCVCIYILLYVQRYIHVQNIHVHTVCTYRGMCALTTAAWLTPWPHLCNRSRPLLFTLPPLTDTRTPCWHCCRRARLSTPKTRYGAPYARWCRFARSLAVSLLFGSFFLYACIYMCVYIYILLYVQRYIHVQNIHVHTVCTYRGMCACAPCPARHDSPLTPPLQQHKRTPLHASAQKGHTNTVLALLQAGAAVDAKDKVRGALCSLMSGALALLLSLSSLALFSGFIWACRV